MNKEKNELINLLKKEPLNSKANELLAYIYYNEGDFNKAHELLLISNSNRNSTIESKYYLGLSYLNKNNYEKAVEWIEHALNTSSEFEEGLINLAICYGYLNKLDKSEEIFLRVLEIFPLRKYICYTNIGIIKSKQNKYEKAIYYFDKALEINPNSEEVLINKSTAYFDLGDFNESLKIINIILDLNKNNQKAIINMAATLNMMSEYEESIKWSNYILNIDEKNELALINLSESFSGQKKYIESIKLYKKINKFSTNYHNTLINKGLIFHNLGKYEKSLKYFDKVLQSNKFNNEALVNKARTLNEICKYDEALVCIDRALAVNFNKANTHLIKAFILFNLNKFENAWIEYEWRNNKHSNDNTKVKLIKKIKQWNGIDKSKKILVWGEQGLGDQILFSTALIDIIKLKLLTDIILDKKLTEVYKNSFPELRFINIHEPINLNEYDYQISIISIQKYLRKNINDFTCKKIPFLKKNDKNKYYKINKINDELICGLSWLSFNEENGFSKSIPFENFSILIENSNIRFIDLQYYPSSEKIIETSTDQLEKIKGANFYENFDLLVEMVDQCDFIVTCSNTTAHLAGAMGKRTYLLLPKYKGRHWYWKKINGKSIFYPTVTILEQKTDRNWKELIYELNKLIKI